MSHCSGLHCLDELLRSAYRSAGMMTSRCLPGQAPQQCHIQPHAVWCQDSACAWLCASVVPASRKLPWVGPLLQCSCVSNGHQRCPDGTVYMCRVELPDTLCCRHAKCACMLR